MNFIKTVIAVLVAQLLLIFDYLFGLGVMTALFSSSGTRCTWTRARGSWSTCTATFRPTTRPSRSRARSSGKRETLTRMLDNLDKAAADKRIDGVIMKISSSNSLGMASMGELRDRIAKVKKAGKEVLAYSDSLDRNALYLASACDSIFMPEVADVAFTGMGEVDMFAKGTLDKLGVHQNLHKIKAYKTAAEIFQRDSMSPEAKEMAGWMMDEMWDVELGAISRDRGLPVDSLETCMKQALFTASEAKAAGLIDGLLYWDQLEDRLGGDDFASVTEDTYDDVTRGEVGLRGKHRVAVVHAYGMIGGRESRSDASFGVLIGHETVIDDLRAAEKTTAVKAIIFRVDSPGRREPRQRAHRARGGPHREEETRDRVDGRRGGVGRLRAVLPRDQDRGRFADHHRLDRIHLWQDEHGRPVEKGGVTFDYGDQGSQRAALFGHHGFRRAQWKRVNHYHNARSTGGCATSRPHARFRSTSCAR